MKLHLGCGHRRLEGFTHIDIMPSADPDLVADISNLGDFDDASVVLIYASHVLEHVPKPRVLKTLQEWHRVLRPGGVLRISVPDFQAMAELYMGGVSMWRVVGPVCGRQNYEANTHYMVYDYEYLAWWLGEAGFYDVRTWDPNITLPAGYDDYSLARINGRLISLNVEATA